jgi:hypothetical protein
MPDIVEKKMKDRTVEKKTKDNTDQAPTRGTKIKDNQNQNIITAISSPDDWTLETLITVSR